MSYYFTLALVLFLYMTGWFCLSVVKKRNDVADIAWGLGFVLLAWAAMAMTQITLRGLMVNALVAVWGIRLALHIWQRNKKKQEDYRYANWRKEWGKLFYLRSYLEVYLLQGLFLFLIVQPVVFIHNSPNQAFTLLDGVGLVVWAIGFYFESVGDRQLKEFIANPANKGKLIETGLWRYSRHPNYFGEITQWWGLFVIALSLPGAVLTVIGPVTITVLILFVSGVPLLENKYAGRPDFEEYKRKTSVFIPLPPRR